MSIRQPKLKGGSCCKLDVQPSKGSRLGVGKTWFANSAHKRLECIPPSGFTILAFKQVLLSQTLHQIQEWRLILKIDHFNTIVQISHRFTRSCFFLTVVATLLSNQPLSSTTWVDKFHTRSGMLQDIFFK